MSSGGTGSSLTLAATRTAARENNVSEADVGVGSEALHVFIPGGGLLASSPSAPLSTLALRGDSDDISSGECITDPTATATEDGTEIAAQCCTSSGDCRRKVDGFDDSCVACTYNGINFISMTHA